MNDDEYTAYCAYIASLKERPERKPHRLPIENYATSDCEFFFTICADDRQAQPFTNATLAQSILDSLVHIRKQYGWTLYCYCLMPDHLHFIARLPEREIEHFDAGARGVVPKTILDHIGAFKSFTTSQIWWKQGHSGVLWQKSSYDSAIRYNDSIRPAVLYVLNNPVRAGLVAHWEDYPYSRVVDAVL